MTAPLAYPFPDPPAELTAIDVAAGIKWMRLPLPMALDHVNVYALDDGDSWTLVDTGMSSRRTKAIWQGLMAVTLAGKPVTRLIATHHHPDHLGLAGWFQDQGVELLIPRTAWLYGRMLTLDEHQSHVPEALQFLTRAGVGKDITSARAGQRPFNFCDVVSPMPLGFTRIDEGDELQAGGRRWLVRLGQGHAPDHATLWSLDDPIVLAGDQVLATISPNIGVYATEPEADPLTEWLASCRRFRPLAAEDQLVLPGHKLPFTGLPRRLDEMIAEQEEALDRLQAHLTTPSRAVECFAPLFKRDIGPDTFNLALAETVAHLNCLRKAGRAARQLGPDGAWVWRAT
ncbi:MBL fold metallo-hydrolase [bacterium]|nr:MBL fold metallo-hydrolase [bacterium]